MTYSGPSKEVGAGAAQRRWCREGNGRGDGRREPARASGGRAATRSRSQAAEVGEAALICHAEKPETGLGGIEVSRAEDERVDRLRVASEVQSTSLSRRHAVIGHSRCDEQFPAGGVLLHGRAATLTGSPRAVKSTTAPPTLPT